MNQTAKTHGIKQTLRIQLSTNAWFYQWNEINSSKIYKLDSLQLETLLKEIKENEPIKEILDYNQLEILKNSLREWINVIYKKKLRKTHTPFLPHL